MLRFAADENFNGDIVRGLLRRNPKLVRVYRVPLSQIPPGGAAGRPGENQQRRLLPRRTRTRARSFERQWGYLLPFVPGVALALLGRGLEDRPTSHMIARVASGVVLFVGVAWWNAHTARKLQNDIDALDAS